MAKKNVLFLEKQPTRPTLPTIFFVGHTLNLLRHSKKFLSIFRVLNDFQTLKPKRD